MSKRLQELMEATAETIDAASDLLYLHDVSATSSGDRKITVQQLASAMSTCGLTIPTPATLTALRAIPSMQANSFCVLRGFATEFDGDGGLYLWKQGATDADAPPSRVRPADYPGVGVNLGMWFKL